MSVIRRVLGIASVVLVTACPGQRSMSQGSAAMGGLTSTTGPIADPSPDQEPVDGDGAASTDWDASTDWASALANGAPEPVPAEDMATIQKLMVALRVNDRAAVAHLIRYPLGDGIENAQDFIRHFDYFFDSATIRAVLEACKSPWYSWRGTGVERGLIWIESGKIRAITAETEKLRRKRAEAKAADALTLHPSVRNYDGVLANCNTKGNHIRVHEEGETVRYIAWKAGASTASAPELSLVTGDCSVSSGGNWDCPFKRGDYTYEVEIPGICSGENDDCEPHLTVTEGERVVADEVCRDTRSAKWQGPR
jgi:hypothetical protein